MRNNQGSLGEVQLTDGTDIATVDSAGADNISNALAGLATYSRLLGFDGTDWERLITTGSNADGVTAVGARLLNIVACLRMFNGTTWDRVRGEGQDRDAIAEETLGYLQSIGFGHEFNGATWDRRRGNEELALLASAARNSDTSSAEQTNRNSKGIIIIHNVTAATFGGSAALRIKVNMIDPVTSNVVGLYLSDQHSPDVGKHMTVMYPGIAAAVDGSYPSRMQGLGVQPLPRKFNVELLFDANITSLTSSVSAFLVN